MYVPVGLYTPQAQGYSRKKHWLQFKSSLDKIFFFLAAGFPDQKSPANFFINLNFGCEGEVISRGIFAETKI
jgi:hypothetical protein